MIFKKMFSKKTGQLFYIITEDDVEKCTSTDRCTFAIFDIPTMNYNSKHTYIHTHNKEKVKVIITQPIPKHFTNFKYPSS